MAQPLYTWEQLDGRSALFGLFTSREQALEWIGLPADAKEIPPAPGVRGECYDVEFRNQRGARLRLVFPN